MDTTEPPPYLPPELWHQIGSYFNTSVKGGRTELRSLCLVNKRFREIFTPSLYRTINEFDWRCPVFSSTNQDYSDCIPLLLRSLLNNEKNGFYFEDCTVMDSYYPLESPAPFESPQHPPNLNLPRYLNDADLDKAISLFGRLVRERAPDLLEDLDHWVRELERGASEVIAILLLSRLPRVKRLTLDLDLGIVEDLIPVLSLSSVQELKVRWNSNRPYGTRLPLYESLDILARLLERTRKLRRLAFELWCETFSDVDCTFLDDALMWMDRTKADSVYIWFDLMNTGKGSLEVTPLHGLGDFRNLNTLSIQLFLLLGMPVAENSAWLHDILPFKLGSLYILPDFQPAGGMGVGSDKSVYIEHISHLIAARSSSGDYPLKLIHITLSDWEETSKEEIQALQETTSIRLEFGEGVRPVGSAEATS